MLVRVFERDYANLPDSDDAVIVFGQDRIGRGVATVGYIRRACAAKSKDALVCAQRDGWGFYVSDLNSNMSRQPGQKPASDAKEGSKNNADDWDEGLPTLQSS